MKKNVYMVAALFLMGMCIACSSDEVGGQAENQESSSTVLFSGTIAGSRADGDTGGTGEDEDPWHNHFVLNRARIRVVNTVNYSEPDFENDYYEYIYTTQVPDGTPEWDDVTEPNFFPYDRETQTVDREGGFDWADMIPTSGAYVFEAVCYSMVFEPFANGEVYADQTDTEKFWSADLLLAHHAMPLSDIYSLVKLRFWHVFSMVRVQITLPVADGDDDHGFPEDAVEGVTLGNMLRGYTVNYANAIENDGLRTVSADNNSSRGDILMYKVSAGEPENGSQTFEYAAIVPTQSINSTNNRVSLRINTITGLEENPDGSGGYVQHVEEKSYVFVPNQPIEMQQAHMTILKLTTETETSAPVLLSAEVVPWDESYTEVSLTPVSAD